MPTIREYDITYTVGNTYADVRVEAGSRSNAYFTRVPTEEEVNAILGTQDVELRINRLFDRCEYMEASPRLPERSQLTNTSTLQGVFYRCEQMKIAPKLPSDIPDTTKSLRAALSGCSALVQGPVLPKVINDVSYMFRDCDELLAPTSIPPDVTDVSYMYQNDAKLSGEMIVRATPTTYTQMFGYTVKPITLYGDQTLCGYLAATATNNNVSWSPWYDPVPAVTDRGQGSYTTAADMTRMVRNGALAVATYAPGRMVYNTGDIVREDEWIALVEAAQTIDPEVTLSTHYSNLNRIEAAFDSVL